MVQHRQQAAAGVSKSTRQANMTSLEVYKLGVKAKQDGNPESANPFKYGTKDWTYWWDGWVSE